MGNIGKDSKTNKSVLFYSKNNKNQSYFAPWTC